MGDSLVVGRGGVGLASAFGAYRRRVLTISRNLYISTPLQPFPPPFQGGTSRLGRGSRAVWARRVRRGRGKGVDGSGGVSSRAWVNS